MITFPSLPPGESARARRLRWQLKRKPSRARQARPRPRNTRQPTRTLQSPPQQAKSEVRASVKKGVPPPRPDQNVGRLN